MDVEWLCDEYSSSVRVTRGKDSQLHLAARAKSPDPTGATMVFILKTLLVSRYR